jgi:hypothetical protein
MRDGVSVVCDRGWPEQRQGCDPLRVRRVNVETGSLSDIG